MRRIISFLLCFIFLNSICGQTIEEINYLLDSVPHYNHNRCFRDYWQPRVLPDSTKDKVIAVLNGYLPPQRIAQAQKFSRGELQTITHIAKKKCKDDSECIKHTKDSIKMQYIEDRLDGSRTSSFDSEFILSLPNWGIDEAKHILWNNRLNTRTFPKLATFMALSRFGYVEALDSVIKWCRCASPQSKIVLANSSDYIFRQIFDNDEIARYVQSKEIYMSLVDLIDIETYSAYGFSDDPYLYLSEDIVLKILSDVIENRNDEAYSEMAIIQQKWKKYIPPIRREGLFFLERLCSRRIILDVDLETIETVEQICFKNVFDLQIEHLIEVLNKYCNDFITEEDIRGFVQVKKFRQSDLKVQLKEEVRSWLNKYFNFE